jgi:transcriptional regulator with XRE-family HTH domain
MHPAGGQFGKYDCRTQPVRNPGDISYRKEIGLRIALVRQSKRISIAYLARLLGISRPTMYAIEAGTRRLYADQLFTISKALDVSLKMLVGEMPSRTLPHLDGNGDKNPEAILTTTAYTQSSVQRAGKPSE